MSTLKEKAEAILQEKENKLTSGEFLNTATIFGIEGTFGDERNNYIYADEFPGVSDLPAEESIEITSQLNGGDIVINPMTTISSKIGYGVVAEAVGLTADKLVQGETILGINGEVEPINGDTAVVTPTTEPQTISPSGAFNCFTSVEVEAVDESIDYNIAPENIREDITILRNYWKL